MLTAQRYYFLTFVFLVVLSSFLYTFRSQASIAYENIVQLPYRSPNTTQRDAVFALFESIKHKLDAPHYIDPTGEYYKGGNNPVWKRPLRKKLLIVDIDTRVPTGENQILNDEILDWEHLEAKGVSLVSNAVLNHYIYALIHGYDYKFYQARHIPGHHDTWVRPHILRDLIPDYDFVVTMDADVVIPHLEVPFEWLFNRWGIKRHTSIALPWDVQEYENGTSKSTDSKGKRVYNAGFVIVQNSALTCEMLEAWRDCTTETRYTDCAKWKTIWSHEQRAFSEYIRYDFNKTPETIVGIPCNDAMAWPGFKSDLNRDDIDDCGGNFIRHYTLGKDKVKEAGTVSVMQVITDVLQQVLLKEKKSIWYKEPKKKMEEAATTEKSLELPG